MTDRAEAGTRSDGGFLAPRPDSEPVDHCFRCGVETPAGQGLCEEHNPNHLAGPSSTQMHATIFGGVAVGVLGLFLLGRLAVGTSGPFEAAVTSAVVDVEGTAAIAYTVTNAGERDGVADCRVTRDGIPRPDDMAFRTGTLAAGEQASFDQQLEAPPAGTQRYLAEALSVICS